MGKVAIKIYTVHDWNARRPKAGIRTVNRSERIIFHHTAGHHRESIQEAMQYARDIQAFHMGPNGWIDSGHNFLITRFGHILQGRWLTVSAIQAGHMVLSAHCPGQNDQIGIEHEHLGDELMTKLQRDASARLMAWIAWQYNRKVVLPVDPHSAHFATACPANLKGEIPTIMRMGNTILKGGV
jgi:hypothetical protein